MIMNYFKLSLAICISLLLLSCNKQNQTKELSAERRLLDTFFMQAHFDNNDYPDETILLSPKDTNSNEYIERTFYVDLAVTDLNDYFKDSVLSKDIIRKLFELSNVGDIECLINFNNQENTYEDLNFPMVQLYRRTPDSMSSGEKICANTNWKLLFKKQVFLSIDSSIIKFNNIKDVIDSVQPEYKAHRWDNYSNIETDLFPIIKYIPQEISSVKRFKITAKLPRIYSKFKIRFLSCNRILRIMNDFEVTSEVLKIDGINFKKRDLELYLSGLYAELQGIGMPNYKNLKNEYKDRVEYQKFIDKLDKLLSIYREKNNTIYRKLCVYYNISVYYISNYYPNFYRRQSSGFEDFNIRIAELR